MAPQKKEAVLSTMIPSSGITAVAVSGGVDSLYALATLRDTGQEVIALHARMLPPELAPAGYDAMLERLDIACRRLGIPLHILDCVAEFSQTVITPFVHAYARGLTPNPCAHCNATIKFGMLLDQAVRLGASRLATGHYIRLEQTPDGPALYMADDTTKDQSYFLSLVPQNRLALGVFPLADKSKAAIRVELASRDLDIPAPAESQEICFVPSDDYRAFLLNRAARIDVTLPGPGSIILPNGSIIGTHKGLWNYTEGQRRGLGVAWTEPLYVLAKNSAANSLIAGTATSLTEYGREVRAEKCNFLVPFERWPTTVLIRTRFRQTARPATVSFRDGFLLFREESPSGPHARGQIATVYAREPHAASWRLRVLGGGIIT